MTTISPACGAPAEPRIEQFCGAQALRLAASAYGPEDGRPVILLPGAGQTRHAWRRTAQRLAASGCRALALDLRGHGASEWASDGNYSIGAFVADLEAVLATIGRPAVVVGASLGGIAALLAAAAHGSTYFAGLALVDVVPDMRPEGLAHIRAFMRSGMNGFGSVVEAAAAVASYLPGRPAPDSLAGLEKNLREAPDGRWYWHWDPLFHLGSEARSAENMLGKMEHAAPHVRVPTLIVTGTRSEVVDEDGARRLAQLIPGAQWISVADAGHMVAGDQNDRFSAALIDFIRRCLQQTP